MPSLLFGFCFFLGRVIWESHGAIPAHGQLGARGKVDDIDRRWKEGCSILFLFFFLPIFLFVFLNYIKKGKYVSKIEGIDEQDGCREKYSEKSRETYLKINVMKGLTDRKSQTNPNLSLAWFIYTPHYCSFYKAFAKYFRAILIVVIVCLISDPSTK